MTEAARGSRRDPTALPVFALVLVSLTGFLPSSARPSLTLLIPAALVATAIGLPLLARAAWSCDLAARLGLAFGCWALVAAAASSAPLAWTGGYTSGTGAVFTLALVAFWAIGRSVPDSTRPWVVAGFLTGAAVNAAVGVAQGVVDLSSMDLGLYLGDRSTGLLGNPAFLGATCSTAVAVLPVLVRRRLAVGLALAALLAAACQMSGARTSIILLLAAGAWAVTRVPRRTGVALAVALGLGLVVGGVLHANAETSASARLESTRGLGLRVENWQAGVEAGLHEPLTGYGPGRWRAATAPRRSLDLVRATEPDRLYTDAHNLPVEYLATTGLVGAGLFLAWLATAALGLRGGRQPELVAAAGVLFAFHLVNPQHLTLTALLLLLVGAAAPRGDPRPARRGVPVAPVLLTAVALLVSGRLIVGDLVFRAAETDFDRSGIERAGTLLWPWPEPVSAEARILAFRARTQKRPAELQAAVTVARRARDREPDNPIRHIALASLLAQAGRDVEAARAYGEALERNPWSRLALEGRAVALARRGDPSAAAACRRAADIGRGPDAVLERARAACLR